MSADLYQLREESIFYIFPPKFLCTATPTFQVNIDLFRVMDTQDNLHVLFEDQQRPLTKVISDLYQLREESIYYIFPPKFLCTVTPAIQVNIDLYRVMDPPR